jgi:hypothetical protein
MEELVGIDPIFAGYGGNRSPWLFSFFYHGSFFFCCSSTTTLDRSNALDGIRIRFKGIYMANSTPITYFMQ